MNVYLYQAALYCEECGEKICSELDKQGKRPDSWEFDSDDYPKGPYTYGGGESDNPNHCDKCQVFLENSLTRDGIDWLADRLRYAVYKGMVSETLYEWCEFYEDFLPEDLVEQVLDAV